MEPLESTQSPTEAALPHTQVNPYCSDAVRRSLYTAALMGLQALNTIRAVNNIAPDSVGVQQTQASNATNCVMSVLNYTFVPEFQYPMNPFTLRILCGSMAAVIGLYGASEQDRLADDLLVSASAAMVSYAIQYPAK